MDDYGDPILGLGYQDPGVGSIVNSDPGAVAAGLGGLDPYDPTVETLPSSPDVPNLPSISTPATLTVPTSFLPTSPMPTSASLLANGTSNDLTDQLFAGALSVGDSLLNAFVVNPENAQTAEQQQAAGTTDQIASTSNILTYGLLALGLVLVFSYLKK